MTTITSKNNTIYIAGGVVNGSLSNQVWKPESTFLRDYGQCIYMN